MPGSNWYVSNQGAQSGPFPDATFRQMLAAGQVPPGALVWQEGMQGWVPATSIAQPSVPAVPGGMPPPAVVGVHPPKSRALTIVFAIFLPGVHRIYLGLNPGLGVAQLVGCLLLWTGCAGWLINIWAVIEAVNFKTDGQGQPLN